MKLYLKSFANPGDISKERVTIRASSDVDIGDYLLLLSPVREGQPLSGRRNVYWFPDQTVKKDDYVIVYTKAGTTSSKVLESGRTAYFYYLGLKEPYWTSDRTTGAVLIEVADWNLLAYVPNPTA